MPECIWPDVGMSWDGVAFADHWLCWPVPDVVVPRPRGRVNAHTPSSESAMLGGTITGDNDNAELRRYQVTAAACQQLMY